MNFCILIFAALVSAVSMISCSGGGRNTEGIAIVDEESATGHLPAAFLEEIRSFISSKDFVQARASLLEFRELFGSGPGMAKIADYIQKQFDRREDVDAKTPAKLSAVSSYVDAVLSYESGKGEKSLQDIEASLSRLRDLDESLPLLKSVLRAEEQAGRLVKESCLALASEIQRTIREASGKDNMSEMLLVFYDAWHHPDLCKMERGRIISAVESALAEQMNLLREEEKFFGCSKSVPFYRALCQKFPGATSCREAESRIESCSR